MNHKAALATLLIALATNTVAFAEDGERTAPFTAAELEAVYAANIDKRAGDILKVLALTDEAKAARVKDAIVAQYRSLRSRDEAIDGMFQALSKNAPGIETNRGAILKVLSHQLHQHFLTRLAAELTPEQIEQVKDRMTYNKVKVTYDAYCEIMPKLTDAEKAKILATLKTAREEAMDGGSADEKTAIFQKYKDQINAELTANGHNVAQAFRDWEAKHPVTSSAVK